MKYDTLNAENWDLQSEEVLHVIEKLKEQP